MLRIYVVEQGTNDGEASSNKPYAYGHPQLISVPNCISLGRLQQLLKTTAPQQQQNDQKCVVDDFERVEEGGGRGDKEEESWCHMHVAHFTVEMDSPRVLMKS